MAIKARLRWAKTKGGAGAWEPVCLWSWEANPFTITFSMLFRSSRLDLTSNKAQSYSMLPNYGGRWCNNTHLQGKKEGEKRGRRRKIPGDTINNIYCISDASFAVALDSTASHWSRSGDFGAACLTVPRRLNRVANEGILLGKSLRFLLVPNPEKAQAWVALVIAGTWCCCNLAGEANLAVQQCWREMCGWCRLAF